MNSDSKWFDLIEDYLENSLNIEDRQEVERLLKEDESFQDTYRKHLLAHRVVETGAGIHLKEILEGLQESHQPARTVRLLNIRFLAAAAIVLLMLVAAGIWYGKNHYSDKNLAEYYAEVYPAVSNRSTGPVDNAWEKALKLYARGEYDAAIESLSAFTDEGNPYFTDAHFYLGNAFLQSGNPAKAIDQFSIISDLNDSRFGAATDWYLTLSYLARGEEKTASERAERIYNDPAHPYREKAGVLLKDLNRWWR